MNAGREGKPTIETNKLNNLKMKALTSTMIYTEEQSERSTKTPAGNVLENIKTNNKKAKNKKKIKKMKALTSAKVQTKRNENRQR